MKNIIILVVVLTSMSLITVNAQDQSTRYEKQHHSKFTDSHLKQSEQMLLKSIESDVVGMASSGVQTLRELEQVFPEYEFSSLLDPLIKIIKDENRDKDLRILSALALDGLHSDKGDQAIYSVSKNTKNNVVKDVCIALSVGSLKNDMGDKTTN